MPTRLCSDPTCDQPQTYRGRCATHSRENEQTINRAGKQLYNGAKWRNVRRKVLFLNPLCQAPDCESIAEDVHHIVDLADGGAPYDQANLEALCHSHHSQHTRATQTKRGATP